MANIDNAYAAGKKLFFGAYSSYTPSAKALFVKAGRFGKIPHIGDRVYFYSSSLGRVSHVGLVLTVKKSGITYTITVEEGNTSSGEVNSFERNGGVSAIKKYIFTTNEVGGTNRINGFGTPYYSDETCSVEDILEVAYAEVGYIEKASNKQLGDIERNSTEAEKKANIGSNNYTKFGKFVGIVNGQWCEMHQAWLGYLACKKHLEKKQTGWKEENGGWYYYLKGDMVKGKWMLIGGRWYVFDNSGKMITGWFGNDDDVWYYLNPADGAMLSDQWLKYKNKWYYLTTSGASVKNSYVKDVQGRGYCYCDANGEWDGRYVQSIPTGEEVVQ